MRQLVIASIIARYNNGYDELTRHCSERWEMIMAWENELKAKRISIAEYLSKLSDDELLDTFDSQSCQIYR